MLATARDLEQRQQRIDAIVQYRSVANAYPVSREAEYARQRITALTDALRIDAEETRAASIVRRARELEAEGEISMALAHYHQVIKVYPRTPSARSSAERIQMLGGVEAARRQAGSPTRPTH